jgi:hypothetical protein
MGRFPTESDQARFMEARAWSFSTPLAAMITQNLEIKIRIKQDPTKTTNIPIPDGKSINKVIIIVEINAPIIPPISKITK